MSEPTTRGELNMTEDQIEHMASRFLNWKLPAGFNPDGGVSFEKIGNKGTPHEYTREPVGTNLIGYTDAVAMVRHMLEELPDSPDRAALREIAHGSSGAGVRTDIAVMQTIARRALGEVE